MDLFSLCAVDDGVQHGEDQQVDVGHEGRNERGSILAILVNHGQANHGMQRIRTARIRDGQLFKN